MIEGRREPLRRIMSRQASHAGLWLDRFMAKQILQNEALPPNEPVPTHRLADEVAAIPVPAVYQAFFRRWQAGLIEMGARTCEGEVVGRMVVGLGEESVLETSVALHHTYGVPVIPGSALKGLAAGFAIKRLDITQWHAEGAAYRTLFGNTEEAGYVTFLDALYIPGSGAGTRPLHKDVMTVHHPSYYQEGNVAPADWDSPTPVPFVSATGKYLFALAGPDEWVDTAFAILKLALAEMGVGAKTSSGYGRIRLHIASQSADRSASVKATKSEAPVVTTTAMKSRGQVRYDVGKPVIVDASDPTQRLRMDWKALGMDALKEKTPVEYEYEEQPAGKRKVVKVVKVTG